MSRKGSLLANANFNQDIKSTAVKLQDCSTVLSHPVEGKFEPRYDEEIITMSNGDEANWYYMVLSSKNIQLYRDIFSGKVLLHRLDDSNLKFKCRFYTFVYTIVEHNKRISECSYTTEEYLKRKKSFENAERILDDPYNISSEILNIENSQTKEYKKNVSGNGFLFIYAPLHKINKVLQNVTPRRYLSKDLSTQSPAIIPDRQMREFIRLYEMKPWDIHFMKHSILDYAKARRKVRISSGPLEGAEGYIVRIHRDRRLVFSFGSMTLAIGGIHTYPFEFIE